MPGTIYPTHVCFDDSLDLLVEILRAHEDDTDNVKRDLASNLRLCHGITNTLDHPSAHAWVEDLRTDVVIFIGILDGERTMFKGRRSEYYEELKVSWVKKYSYKQAYVLNRHSGHYGPWESRLKDLCRKVDEERAVKP